MGNLFDIDIDRGPRLAVVGLGIGHRTQLVVGPSIRGGVLVDIDTYQVGKTHGCRLHIVGVYNTSAGIAIIGRTDGRLEGLRQEVIVGATQIGQIVKNSIGSIVLLLLLLGQLFLTVITRIVFVIILT